MQLLKDLGFERVEEIRRYDPFAGTSKEKTARHFGVEGVNFSAVRPDDT